MVTKKSYPVGEMKGSLKKLETEAMRLKKLGGGIPAIEKNIRPIMTFLDILDFHLCDLEGQEHS